MTAVSIIAFIVLPNLTFANFKTNSDSLLLCSGSLETTANNTLRNLLAFPFQIDIYDTVFFNIHEGIMNGSIIDIPVSISSNDNIYALDFSFKYNTINLEIDSIINYTSGLQYLYHYNTTDSVFRFTSNRLTPIPNDSLILHIRFTALAGQLCGPDIDSAITYLNGDVSSNSITGCLVTGLPYTGYEERASIIFPNPAIYNFCISDNDNQRVKDVIIYDNSGRIMKIYPGIQPNCFDIDALKPGLYIVEFSSIHSGYRSRIKFMKTSEK